MPTRSSLLDSAHRITAIGLVAGAAGLALSLSGSAASAGTTEQATAVKARAAVLTRAPAALPNPSPTSCPAVLFNGQLYCPASISGIKATTYGTGKRVVLRDVSVTARTNADITIAALENTPCPPDKFCGATLTTTSLRVLWSGSSRPTTPSVINLFGVTRTGSLTPQAYTFSQACYIAWC